MRRYHPDNIARQPDLTLPSPAKGPEPLAKTTELERAKGMWGHQLCNEQPVGPVDSSVKIKTNSVTPKIGGAWNTQFEQNGSRMKSGVYAGTLRVVSMHRSV